MTRKLHQKILDNWEQALFALALLLLVLFGVIVALCSGRTEKDEDSSPRTIVAVRYFRWDDTASPLATPALPAPDKANPFAHTLVAIPPKTEKTQPHKDATKPPAPVTPAPQPPPPKDASNAQPDTPTPRPRTITIQYRGLYVGVSGKPIAMLMATDSKDKHAQTLQIKPGQTFLGTFTVTDITDKDATIQTSDGQLKSIPWNSSYAFECKENASHTH